MIQMITEADDFIRRGDVLEITAETGALETQGRVMRLPAADVRPVVFCKNCQYCHNGYCERFDDLIPFGVAHYEWENWYCADGKRREVDDG